MAFCKFCGAELEEGQTCTCPQSQAAAQPEVPAAPAAPEAPVAPQQPVAPVTPQQPVAPAAPAAPSASSLFFKKLGDLLKAFFKSPAQAIQTAVSEDLLHQSLALVAIRLVAWGLMLFGILNKAIHLSTGMSLMELHDTAKEWGVNAIPGFFGTFGWGLLVGAIALALFVVMVFALSRLQKGTASFKAVLEANSVGGVWVTVLLLASFLLSFISIWAALVLAVMAYLAFMICGTLTAQLLCPENQSGKFWALYIVGVVLVIALTTYIVTKTGIENFSRYLG